MNILKIMNKVLKLDKLHKNYYSREGVVVALDDITLDINVGEYVAIVGPSGCGKSTLLNIIGGIDFKSSGVIEKDDNIKIGYMLQNDCLFPWINILDNCLLGLKINGDYNDDNVKYVLNLLDMYGLKDFIYKYPGSLSGGMKQRVLRIRYTHK